MSSSLLIDAIAGRLDGKPVSILAVDESSAIVEHSVANLTSPPARRLLFVWEGQEIDLSCRVAGSVLQDLLSDERQKLTWHAKLLIEADSDLIPLRRARDSWMRKLELRQEENLMGESGAELPSAAMLSVGQAFRAHKSGYIAFVFREGKWISRESRSHMQPGDGFTVAAFESEQQTQMLKLAYEEADREGRELIRRFAAASLE
ncbi:MAG: hypothetical protein M3P06_18550 [Acidobacteriota bacterium]|nr:hypothetical protein [Acidobacteriota bacterium]